MMKINVSAIIGFCLCMIACKDSAKKNLLPQLAESDSAVVMYYYTAGDPRFFNMTKVYNRNFISLFHRAVNQKTIKAKENCTTQGKIYFYRKKGSVETIYFSRADTCLTLSFIKTGEKYFVEMKKELKTSLDELEKKSITLPSAGE